MKVFNIILVLFATCLLSTSLQAQVSINKKGSEEEAWDTYGQSISSQEIIDNNEVKTLYEGLRERDSIYITFKAEVAEVCQVKGCWMEVNLPENTKTRVTFKDYGFFVPKDLSGEEVVIGGWAFSQVVSVEELKHYAEDAGKTEKEIALINQPVKRYQLVADGVLARERNKP